MKLRGAFKLILDKPTWVHLVVECFSSTSLYEFLLDFNLSNVNYCTPKKLFFDNKFYITKKSLMRIELNFDF